MSEISIATLLRSNQPVRFVPILIRGWIFCHAHQSALRADINERVVDSLERIGEYRKPIWYSSMIASAAPIMFEHDIVFLREELIDGYPLPAPHPQRSAPMRSHCSASGSAL
jgi:hypothetical protein